MFAATDDSAENARIVREAQAAGKLGILGNRHRPDSTPDFAVPAHRRHGDVTIAVATEGDAPALAGAICRELEPKLAAYSETLHLPGHPAAGVERDHAGRNSPHAAAPDADRAERRWSCSGKREKGAYLAYASPAWQMVNSCRRAENATAHGQLWHQLCGHPESMTIGAVESAAEQAFPEMDVFRAFTSGMIIRKMRRQGHCGRYGAGGAGEAETARAIPTCTYSPPTSFPARSTTASVQMRRRIPVHLR